MEFADVKVKGPFATIVEAENKVVMENLMQEEINMYKRQQCTPAMLSYTRGLQRCNLERHKEINIKEEVKFKNFMKCKCICKKIKKLAVLYHYPAKTDQWPSLIV